MDTFTNTFTNTSMKHDRIRELVHVVMQECEHEHDRLHEHIHEHTHERWHEHEHVRSMNTTANTVTNMCMNTNTNTFRSRAWRLMRFASCCRCLLGVVGNQAVVQQCYSGLFLVGVFDISAPQNSVHPIWHLPRRALRHCVGRLLDGHCIV